MNELNLHSTYFFADLVENYIKSEIHLWNYPHDEFIDRSLNFRKETILHLYIETTIFNHFDKDISKYGGDYIERIFFFKNLFEAYSIKSNLFNKLAEDEDSSNFKTLHSLNENFKKKWEKHEKDFRVLFNKIADDVFYIFFGNRNLLLQFNQIVTNEILSTDLPKDSTNKSGCIKRKIYHNG